MIWKKENGYNLILCCPTLIQIAVFSQYIHYDAMLNLFLEKFGNVFYAWKTI